LIHFYKRHVILDMSKHMFFWSGSSKKSDPDDDNYVQRRRINEG